MENKLCFQIYDFLRHFVAHHTLSFCHTNHPVICHTIRREQTCHRLVFWLEPWATILQYTAYSCCHSLVAQIQLLLYRHPHFCGLFCPVGFLLVEEMNVGFIWIVFTNVQQISLSHQIVNFFAIKKRKWNELTLNMKCL